MTTPQRWQEIDRIFADALECEPAERAAFLEEACGGDEELRKEVESLLANDMPESLAGDHAVQEATRLLVKKAGERTIDRIGRYQIIRSLGAGGMGRVYLGLDEQLNRPVAVKLLSNYNASEEERMRRFRREALSASALNHPNILTIYEIGEFEGANFITAEFVDGVTLRARMKAEALPTDLALDIAIQIVSALAAAHAAGIIHRDIKSENVMVRADGLVKVLDFGIAKFTQAGDSEKKDLVETMPGAIIGTAAYMSPEQARGALIDTRTDIWSLGVILYEMVAGRRPFEGNTPADVIAAILERQPPSLPTHNSVALESLELIVFKALQKERKNRYQTAAELLTDLKQLRQTPELVGEEGRLDSQQSSASPGGIAGPPLEPKTVDALPVLMSGEVGTTGSSAEYVVGRIKHHKYAVLAVLVTLMAAAGFLAYRSLLSNKTRPIESIAVMPFVNESGNPDVEYLSDGMTESVINSLSQLPGVKVIARSSSFKYKGKEIESQEVARALGVEAILTGRVLQRGENLLVSVELVDARDKTQVWGGQYNRKVTDVQTVQEEMARTISEKLRVKLTGAQERQLTKQATENPEAYQVYLNGLFYNSKGEAGDIRKALDYYNQAVTLDPNFALAWLGVARAYQYFAGNSLLDPKEALAKAKAATEKALRLDEKLAEAHAAMGRIKQAEWDWTGAEREFKRALELNPNLADAHFRYAGYLTLMGQHTEASAAIKRAHEIDPLRDGLRVIEANGLYLARRYDEALGILENAVKLEPNNSSAHFSLGLTYAWKGMYEQAISELRKVISIQGETTTSQCYLAYALAMAGKKSEARTILDKLKTTKDYVSPTELATLYVGLGDTEGAIASLERAHAAHDLQLQFLKVAPDMDSLRSDPRFAELIRKVGLPQ